MLSTRPRLVSKLKLLSLKAWYKWLKCHLTEAIFLPQSPIYGNLQACTTISSKRRGNKLGNFSRNKIVGKAGVLFQKPCLNPFIPIGIYTSLRRRKKVSKTTPQEDFPPPSTGAASRPSWILHALPLTSPGCLCKISYQVTVANFNCNVAGNSWTVQNLSPQPLSSQEPALLVGFSP